MMLSQRFLFIWWRLQSNHHCNWSPQPDRRDAKASAKCPASAACCSACSTKVALGQVRDTRTSYHSVNYRVRLFRWHGWCHLDNNLGFYYYSWRNFSIEIGLKTFLPSIKSTLGASKCSTSTPPSETPPVFPMGQDTSRRCNFSTSISSGGDPLGGAGGAWGTLTLKMYLYFFRFFQNIWGFARSHP